MNDPSMVSDVEMSSDVSDIDEEPSQTQLAAAATLPDHQQQQQRQQHQGLQQQSSGFMWIHALLPTQLAKGCTPFVSIMQNITGRKDGSRTGEGQQQALPTAESLLLLDKAQMQLVQPAGQNHNYWCLGPIETDHWSPDLSSSSSSSSSRGVSRTLAVSLHLPSKGLSRLLSGGKSHTAVQLQQQLLPGCHHQFVLQPVDDNSKQESSSSSAGVAAAEAAARATAELAAVMAGALVHPLQKGQQQQQKQQLPAVFKQLEDLLMHCRSYSSSNSPSVTSGSRSSRTLFVIHTVLLLAQQLPGSTAAELLSHLTTNVHKGVSNSSMQWEEATEAAAAAAAGAAPADAANPCTELPEAAAAAASALLAFVAIQLLTSLSADAVRSLPEKLLLQLQQAVSACLQVLSVLSHVHLLPPATSVSSSSSTNASTWLQQLQACLKGTLTANVAGNILQCCNLQSDVTWLAALPALVGLMQRPSLGFLYSLRNLPRQGCNAHWQPPQQQQQHMRQSAAAVQATSGFAETVLLMCRQLAAINSDLAADAASSMLLSAVLSLAPSLQDLLQLHWELPPLLQQLAPRHNSSHNSYNRYSGSHITAEHRIRAAVDAALQQASVEDLLQCWGSLTAQGLQDSFRQGMQQAVLAAVQRLKYNSASSTGSSVAVRLASSGKACSSSSSYLAATNSPLGGTAAMASAAAFGSSIGCMETAGAASISWELLSNELLFGSLFQGGPGQLLQQLLQCQPYRSYPSSSGNSSWSLFVSFHLVPAALQQLLAAEAAVDTAAAAAAAKGAAVPDACPADSAGDNLRNTSAEEQQQQQQQQHSHTAGAADSKPYAIDVPLLIRHWLLHLPLSASSISAAGAGTQPQAIKLYCAAEQLLRNCPYLQQLVAKQFPNGAQPPAAGAAAAAATAAADAVTIDQQPDDMQPPQVHQDKGVPFVTQSSSSNLLDHLLEVLANELTAAVLQHGQLLQVLQAAKLLSNSCGNLLQQHYLQILQQFLMPEPEAEIPAALQSSEPRQRLRSSWESADMYVSAVLGCAAGSKGCSSLLHASSTAAAAVAEQQHVSNAVAGDTAAPDEQWQTVRSKRQRQSYRQLTSQQQQQQQQQQQESTAVSALQQQVLLLLADCLVDESPSTPSTSSTAAVLEVHVALLQDTEGLLIASPLCG
jgi:hypothetical protein